MQVSIEGSESLHPHIVSHLSPSSPPRGDCSLDIIYELPASVFVDPNQLNDLLAAHQHWVFGETDLEAPLEHVQEPRGSVVIVRQLSGFDVALDLPIHLRYQRPSYTDTHRPIEIAMPRVGWTCPVSDENGAEAAAARSAVAETAKTHPFSPLVDKSLPPLEDIPLIPLNRIDPMLYTFVPLGSSAMKSADVLHLKVPVGDMREAGVVQLGTGLCVLICSLWILWAVWKSIQKARRSEAKGKRRKSE
ncbi:PIG-X [Dichotomocladium elegans]|nr:PIG-X [Dichotomocladium elegans]